MTSKFSYDAVPYPSFTFPQTNPSRLAVMGVYHGMAPASPESCRVLELGCGDGANLMSFASIFPTSEFLGIDLSAVHIDEARSTAEQLGLDNTAFLQRDVTEFDRDSFGEFDFIIAHGLYSWVPDFVREKTLEIYRACLTANGIGYISYNVYPGSYFRDISRNLMKFHTDSLTDPIEKVREGMEILSLIGDYAAQESAYQAVLRAEYEAMTTRRPQNVFHDELGEINQPFYFYEFAADLEKHGLQYISECHPWDHRSGISDDAENVVAEISDDLIRSEQYRDFIRCRRFRSSLVCRSDIKLDQTPTTDVVKTSYIISKVRSLSVAPNLGDGVPEKFASPRDQTIEINHPLTKAALVYLERIWARSASFDELIANAQQMFGNDGAAARPADIERTAAFLLQMFEAGFIALDRFRATFATSAGEFPETSRFVKWQIMRGSDNITTLTGMNMELDNELIKFMILLLDGTRTRDMVFAEVLQQAKIPEGMRDEYEKALPGLIEENLNRLVQSGMLVTSG